MKNGILLIATGHSNYGGMAYNLAVTLKAAEKEMPIALVHDESAMQYLTDEQKQVFDQFIPTDKKGLNLKLNLAELSPFEKTLYLDVDTLWLPTRKSSELFSLLADRPFTAQNEGFTDLDTMEDSTSKIYMFWGRPEEIAVAYGLKGKLYQFRSELILFESTKEVKAMFANAQKLTKKKAKIEVVPFAGTVPDEYYLNIAANQAGFEPHQSNWQPGYWIQRELGIVPPLHKLCDKYYFMSFGGNTSPKELKRFYADILGAAANTLGLPVTVGLQSKRKYLAERSKY